MRRILFALLALSFSFCVFSETDDADSDALESKVDESKNPTGCMDTGHHYILKTVLLKPGEAGAQQSLFFFYNKLNQPLNLFQTRGEDSSRSLFLNHTIQPHQWAVLAASEKSFRFICATPSAKKRYGQVVSCADSVKICEFTSVRYGMNNRGNFWMVGNSSRNGALSGVVHYGVIP